MADNIPGHSVVALRVAAPPHLGEMMTSPMRSTQAAVAFGAVTYISTNFLPLRPSLLLGLLAAYYIYNDEPSPARRLAGNLYRLRPSSPLPPRAAYS